MKVEPLDSTDVQPVNPKGNKPWIFMCRTMLKFQYFGHLMWRDESLEKTMSFGKIEGKREGSSRRWDGWLNEHEFEWSPGDSGQQRSLAYYSPWGSKEVDKLVTEQKQQIFIGFASNFHIRSINLSLVTS